ncbi:hypothetical protein DKX38_023426 [Salix brachista]|uniref:Uncharacterized protein n=1 Tax=Salix brachista TaxID=2182728 RepID=A0A5N5JWN0_9ROSI|nr:hypothetical protein DKX38_023426 [Salix brachista]
MNQIWFLDWNFLSWKRTKLASRGKLLQMKQITMVLQMTLVGWGIVSNRWRSEKGTGRDDEEVEAMGIVSFSVTWPMYAEQQLNAFQMVNELGLAIEMTSNYRMGSNALVMADKIAKSEYH